MNKFINKFKNLIHSVQGVAAETYYGLPYKQLKFIAVTGTDGKTTTTQMIYHILSANNLKVAYLSTISAKINGIDYDTGFHVTSPDPWVLPKYLKKMVEAKVEFVVLETTSQGLEQNRAILIPFEASVITNIKSDHLDYHGSWENYAKAKFKIIEKTKDGGTVAINQDDRKLFSWIKDKFSQAKVRAKSINWYSFSETENFKQDLNGLSFRYQGQEFNVPIVGRFNLSNTLAAIKITQKYLGLEKIAKALTSFKSPKGRMEVVSTKPFTTIIDFAHTPNALRNALETVNEIKNPESRIICVYGCAGQRDKARRKMGEVSAKLADITILTAEDPRDEDLKEINNDIINSAKNPEPKVLKRFASRNDYLAEDIEKYKTDFKKDAIFFTFDENNNHSREDAIDFALKIAQKGDVVFFTGKAHEQSLAFGNEEFPWDEHKHVREALSKLS